MRPRESNYGDYMRQLYSPIDVRAHAREYTRNITFMVTDACVFACNYCYETHKGNSYMSFDTAKKIVDMMFDMWDRNNSDFINQNTCVPILEFIGGEPLMNIEVIDKTCEYFWTECLKRDHIWADTWRASMISNGEFYFDPKVQSFLKKYGRRVSFGITVDGTKKLHDSCRVRPDGSGTFDAAYAAMKHYNDTYGYSRNTKVTISQENLPYLHESIEFFVNEGYTTIFANTIYEAEWTINDAKLYYNELKLVANYLLELDRSIYTSLFEEEDFCPMLPEDNNNWCGGNAQMVSFAPDGVAYPCIRYMETSLNGAQPPIVIGNVDDGIYQRPQDKKVFNDMNKITRRSQSTDECFYCPIAKGCAHCTAYNYQLFGTANRKYTGSCIMHKARSLANVYYFNNLNGYGSFEMHCPEDWALEIVPREEYEYLKKISTTHD